MLVNDMIMCANFLAEEEDKLPEQKYVVEGSAAADEADQDFDLVMDAQLAVNEYPAEKFAAHRAADHTSLCAQNCTPEVRVYV